MANLLRRTLVALVLMLPFKRSYGESPILKRTPPEWKIPTDLAAIVADDGIWESDHWHPISVSVHGDTVYRGRPIALAWQIEFSPDEADIMKAGQRLFDGGQTPDGDDWASLIVMETTKQHSELKDQIYSDSEQATCVIWVETEAALKALIGVVWELIYA